MLEIIGFRERHAPAVHNIRRKRSPATRTRAVRLEYVSIDSDPSAPEALGEAWTTFCDAVGGRNATAFWTYLLQFAGLHAADTGIIRVDRKSFGRLVLSRNTDIVSDRDGVKCYDALIQAGLAREVEKLPTPVAEPDGEKQEHPAPGGPSGGLVGSPSGSSDDGPTGSRPGGPSGSRPGSRIGCPSGGPVLVPEPEGTTPLPPAERGSGCAAAGSSSTSSTEPTPSEWAAAPVIARALAAGEILPLTPREHVELGKANQDSVHGPPDGRAAARRRGDEIRAMAKERTERALAALERNDHETIRWLYALLGTDPRIERGVRAAQRAVERDRRGRRGAPMPPLVVTQSMPAAFGPASPAAVQAPLVEGRAQPERKSELAAMTDADREHVLDAVKRIAGSMGQPASVAEKLLAVPPAERTAGWWAKATLVYGGSFLRPRTSEEARDICEGVAQIARAQGDGAVEAEFLLLVQPDYRWGLWYRRARKVIELYAKPSESQRAGTPAEATA